MSQFLFPGEPSPLPRSYLHHSSLLLTFHLLSSRHSELPLQSATVSQPLFFSSHFNPFLYLLSSHIPHLLPPPSDACSHFILSPLIFHFTSCPSASSNPSLFLFSVLSRYFSVVSSLLTPSPFPYISSFLFDPSSCFSTSLTFPPPFFSLSFLSYLISFAHISSSLSLFLLLATQH